MKWWRSIEIALAVALVACLCQAFSHRSAPGSAIAATRFGAKVAPRCGLQRPIRSVLWMGRRSEKIATRKGAADAAKSKLFARAGKRIAMAVKAGGGADPVVNTLLAEAIREASAWGVPKDNIQRTIAKASHANSEDFKEAVFEMYGHGGVALIVTCLTDSVNRAATMVRTAARDAGARMADPGSVTFQFRRTSALELQQQAGEVDDAAEGSNGSSSGDNEAGAVGTGPAVNENAILELALEQGVDDIQVRASSDPAGPTTVLGEAPGLKVLRQALEAKGVVCSLVFTYVPHSLVECSDEDREKNFDLIDDLKQLDDVDSVDHNMQLR